MPVSEATMHGAPGQIGWVLGAIVAAATFAVVFAAFWSLTVVLLSWLSGWRTLARRWPAESRPVPQGALGSAFGQLGWVSYRGVLVVGLDEAGLYLSVWRLFAAGHPPLHLPWSALRFVGEWQMLFVRVVRIDLGGVVTLSISARRWEALDAELRRRVPGAPAVTTWGGTV